MCVRESYAIVLLLVDNNIQPEWCFWWAWFLTNLQALVTYGKLIKNIGDEENLFYFAFIHQLVKYIERKGILPFAILELYESFLDR